MITRSIDGDNDWKFGKGKQDYLSEKDALAQNIKTGLQSFVKDCFFDLTFGVDWWAFLGSKNQTALKNAIVKQILSTTGVLSLDEIDLKLDENRNLAITYNVTSIWGEKITDITTLG